MNKWTNEELQILKEHYPNDSLDNILSLIKRNKGDIISKASELKIARNSRNKKIIWTNEEIEILRRVYLTTKIADIPKLYLPNKTKDSIVKKMGELRLLKSRPWEADEIEMFKTLYPYTDNQEMCKIFNRTYTAIINASRKFGVSKDNRLTDEDVEFIKANYLKMLDKEIAQVIGHHWRVIKDKRLRLGLKHMEPVLGNNFRDLAELLRKRTERWRAESMAWCNYQCVIGGGKFDVIHHLYSVNQIMEEVLDGYNLPINVDPYSLSTDVLDSLVSDFATCQYKYGFGVCLTNELHRQFHFEYGYGDNTKEQFLEFVEKHNYKLIMDI